MINRRSNDKCLIKRLYAKYTPHIQVAGFLWLVAGGFIAVQAIVQEAQAFGKRLTTVERAQMQFVEHQKEIKHSVDVVQKNLDLIVRFFQIPRKE